MCHMCYFIILVASVLLVEHNQNEWPSVFNCDRERDTESVYLCKSHGKVFTHHISF